MRALALALVVLAVPAAARAGLGQQLYAEHCSTCHGSAGQGIPKPLQGAGGKKGQGPSLVGVGALAADFYLRTGYMPLERVGLQPRRGGVSFDEQEIRALVHYVASLGQGPPIPRPDPARGDVAAGQRLFEEHCAGCHQIALAGGYVTGAVAPPLRNVTPVEVAEAVRIGPFVMPTFGPRQLSDRDLDSLTAYVREAQHPQDRGGWPLGHVGPVPEGLVTWLLASVALVAVCVLIGRRNEA
jgi:ubiquinol-cytochrome c reductase cytochrome c subunit